MNTDDIHSGSEALGAVGETAKVVLDAQIMADTAVGPIVDLTDRDRYRLFLRSVLRGIYDKQANRIRDGNRIVADSLIRMGIKPGTKKKDADNMAKKIMKDIEVSYRRITDGLANKRRVLPAPAQFKADGIIDQYVVLAMVHGYFEMLKLEEAGFKCIGEILTGFPFWNAWLGKVKGIGPAMGGVILAEIDIYKTPYCSSLFKFCGIDVAEDKKGRSRRPEHLVDREYKDRNGKIKTRKSITYNPFLKTKCMGVLAMSLVVHNPYFKAVYYNYRMRMEEHPIYGIHNDWKLDPAWVEKTKNMTAAQKAESSFGKWLTTPTRRENMCKRYVVRTFLKRLYEAWKKFEKLEVKQPWEEKILGFKPHGGEPCEECGVRTEEAYGYRLCPCGKYTIPEEIKVKWRADAAARKVAVKARQAALGVKYVAEPDEAAEVEADEAEVAPE